jgi:hypothetical protein
MDCTRYLCLMMIHSTLVRDVLMVFINTSRIIFLVCIIILGTQVAGIIAANATDITQTGYIPVEPFLGVAPQATIGSCKFIVSSIELTHSCILLPSFYRSYFRMPCREYYFR